MKRSLSSLWLCAAVLLVLSACAKPKPGEQCTGETGCTTGSECLSIGTNMLPDVLGTANGICFLRAVGNCPKGQEKKELARGRYCVQVAPAGKACGAELMCEGDAECLYSEPSNYQTPGVHPGTCRVPCGYVECPTGESCQMILPPKMPGMPENDPMSVLSMFQGARQFCMPTPPESAPAPRP